MTHKPHMSGHHKATKAEQADRAAQAKRAQAHADPFGYTASSARQAQALNSAPKAKSSFAGPAQAVARAVGKVGFSDDSFRNQFGKAQAGRLKQIDTQGLTKRQISVLRQVMSGKTHGY